MKVADFQKYLRALAEVIATKTPAAELKDAAEALAPFAAYSMHEFAAFLQAAEAKYGATGELPDAKPPKVARPKNPRTAGKAKTPPPTVDDLLLFVNDFKLRLRTDHSLRKDHLVTELARFSGVKKADLIIAVQRLGLTRKPKTISDAHDMIVNHTLAAQSGIERADA